MGRSELLRSMMSRILSVAWCCACATAGPLLDLAIPLDDACEAGSKDCDLSLLQLRGQLKIADEQEKKEQKEAKKKMKEEKKEKKKEAKKEKRKDKMEKKEKKKLRKEEKQGKGKGGQEDRGSDNSGSANGAFLFETSPADDKKAVEKKKKTQE